MVSQKVSMILKSKTDFSDEYINSLTESQAWNYVYSVKNNNPTLELSEICFTGFRPSRKKELWEIALKNRLKVVKSVTKNLSYLVCGNNVGPVKLQKAKCQNAEILSEEDFFNLLKTL